MYHLYYYIFQAGASQLALVVKTPLPNPGDAKDVGSIPGSGRSSGVGNENPLQYSCLQFHGQRSLAGYSWHGKKSDATKHHYHHQAAS